MSNFKDDLIKYIDFVTKPLIWLSIGLLFWETMAYKTENSLESPWWFIWSERIIAGLMTIELFLRANHWKENKGGAKKYFAHPLGMIDILAVVPFWFGFFLPTSWLHMVRTLRVLRLLKFFRYSRSLQLVALAFYRSWFRIKALGFAMMIIALFCTFAMYEAEHKAQPEAFSDLFNAAWFTAVTVTTVGYGDISPSTVIGKLVAMGTFAFGLVVFAGIVGVLGSSFSDVLAEEDDPNIDPLDQFAKVFAKNQRIKEIDNEHQAAD